MKSSAVSIRSEEEENEQTKKDLIFTVLLNLLLLAILFGLYFFNQATGKIDSLFSQLLKF